MPKRLQGVKLFNINALEPVQWKVVKTGGASASGVLLIQGQNQ